MLGEHNSAKKWYFIKLLYRQTSSLISPFEKTYFIPTPDPNSVPILNPRK